jgi:hypothetical protein
MMFRFPRHIVATRFPHEQICMKQPIGKSLLFASDDKFVFWTCVDQIVEPVFLKSRVKRNYLIQTCCCIIFGVGTTGELYPYIPIPPTPIPAIPIPAAYVFFRNSGCPCAYWLNLYLIYAYILKFIYMIPSFCIFARLSRKPRTTIF